jgi:hypothetical protein
MRLQLKELIDLGVDLREEPPRHLSGGTRRRVFCRWCLWSGFLIVGVAFLVLGLVLLVVGVTRRLHEGPGAGPLLLMGYVCVGLSVPMLLAGMLPVRSVTRLLERGVFARATVLAAKPIDALEPSAPNAWQVQLQFTDRLGRQHFVSQVLTAEELAHADGAAGVFVLYDDEQPQRLTVLAGTSDRA